MIFDLDDDYKPYLGIDDYDLDDKLESFAEEAEATVKDYLNRDLTSGTYTEYFDGNGTNQLILGQFPITSVTSISVWDDADEEWDALVEDTDYERLVIKEGDYCIYLDDYVFEKGTHNYKVVYVAGYETASIPYKIKLACKKIMKLLYDESPLKNNTLGKQSFQKGASGQGENFGLDLNAVDRVLKTIRDYRAENV